MRPRAERTQPGVPGVRAGLERVTIRPMNPRDVPRALRLWRASEGIGLNESDTPARLRAFLARNPGLSQVAVCGRRLVGAVLCGHEGRRGYLHHLAVASEWRRSGIARRLVEGCLLRLARLGLAKCNLFLFAAHRLGRGFWRHLGWTVRDDLVVMQTRILPRPGAEGRRPAFVQTRSDLPAGPARTRR